MSKLLEAKTAHALKKQLISNDEFEYEISDNDALIETEDDTVLITFRKTADVSLSELPRFWKWNIYVSTTKEGNLTLQYLQYE